MTAPLRRNEPCPCGSGRKYKHCCGKTAADASAPKAAAAGRCSRCIICWARRSRSVACSSGQPRASGARPLCVPSSPTRITIWAKCCCGWDGRTPRSRAARRALALRPRFAAALGNLANAERARGGLAAAITGYRRVIALEPGLAEAHRNLGSALLETGETEAGIHSLQRAIELRPEFAAAVDATRACADRRGSRSGGDSPLRAAVGARTRASPPSTSLRPCWQGSGATRRRQTAIATCSAGCRTMRGCTPTSVMCCTASATSAPRSSIAGGRSSSSRRMPEAHLHLGNSLLALNALHEADARLPRRTRDRPGSCRASHGACHGRASPRAGSRKRRRVRGGRSRCSLALPTRSRCSAASPSTMAVSMRPRTGCAKPWPSIRGFPRRWPASLRCAR